MTGTVQGVGFRPFVYGLAEDLGLSGHVGNDVHGVFIEVQGAAVDVFVERLRTDAPPMARVGEIVVTAMEPSAAQGFRIVDSHMDAGVATTSIPADTAVCADCLAEMRDPSDRRFGYPFIACTNCGPRFTMVAGLPYDRANTSMAAFPLCTDCETEYRDPRSRRFHAQPTACGVCGPRLSMPIAEVVAALASGQIVAIKGIGGYHLVCDARDQAAVRRLRERKARGDKPFAVMARDLVTARAIARLNADAEGLLQTPARPILLAGSRDPRLQADVAPGNSFIGVMLPYTPLHHLLFDADAPAVLVMTSGNLSDEPICTDPQEAESRLAGIADIFCHHDRVIQISCDDSVVRQVAGVMQPVRRSRGYVPRPIGLPMGVPAMLAVGGEIKAAAAVAHRDQAWLTQHIGDVENLETLQMLERSVRILSDLQRIEPEVVVSDAHPGYLSRRWGAQYAAERGATHMSVQHHHAHLASLLAEHAVPPDRRILGVVFDGTGYGTDSTIWGGELLLGSYSGVQRVGHLRPISLPGGDAAVRFPGRVALAHLDAAGFDLDDSAPARGMSESDLRLLKGMLRSGSHCTPTTSMGRLFDAVAALLDVRQRVDYEAQAAIELEALAADSVASPWPAQVELVDGQVVIDPGGWIAAAVRAHREGQPVGQAAAAFHLGLADAVVAAVREVAVDHEFAGVGLTGGVFANAVLSRACAERLSEAGFEVLTHRVVPPNDGGLALGQVCVAATSL
ncbi:MAG: carbamoyltransferase HypF [Candidatus Nanopelagicales bacterium]|nr:carbamoyltransferase HypF [Candidatus Nanopelagicales bacterium]